MSAIMVKGRSRREIGTIAENIRAMTNKMMDGPDSYDDLYFPIVQFVELLGTISDENGVLLNSEILPDYKLPNVYAQYSPERNTIFIRESVYTRACAGEARDRFTIAHELGHCVLGHGAFAFSRVGSGAVPAYADPEWQANVFASMLLIPRSRIRGMSPKEIVAQCGVSLQAAEIALKK